MTEIQRYRVISKQQGYEIRNYEPFITVSANESGSLASSGNKAFRQLANYIFGGNKQGQQIAMTAPVTQKKSLDGYQVSFVMPASMSITQMPTPATSNLEITEHPSGEYAAIRFSGLASEGLFLKKEQTLRQKLADAGLRADGEATYARYNGPWTPGPLRRNEVLIAL